MSHAYSSSEPEFAKARDLDELESRVNELDNNVSRRIDSVESQNATLQDSVDELSGDVTRQTRAGAQLRKEFEQLQRRMQRQTAWMQRAAVVQPEAVATDLDAVDDQIKKWAEALRRGNAIHAQLLSRAMRSAHQTTLARYDAWLDKSNDLDTAQISGARALAATPDMPVDADWALFNSTKDDAKQHRDIGRYYRQHAEEARAALEADDALRAGFQPQIDTYVAAERALHNMIVSRFETMAKKGLVGPLWFALALGDWPRDERTTAWLETAVELVKYRIVYGVTDPIEALGRPQYASEVQEQRRAVNAKAIADYQ